MTPEREKELLGLIEAYWRIRFPENVKRFDEAGLVLLDSPEHRSEWFNASWAESEACLREVAGECAVRGADWETVVEDEEGGSHLKLGDHWGEDRSRPVALLRAFVSAFGGKEPRGE